MTANQKVKITAAMSFIEEKEEKLHGNISQHGRIYRREQRDSGERNKTKLTAVEKEKKGLLLCAQSNG